MTTTPDDDVTQTTGTSAAPSSTPRGIEFYFQCAVVVIGVVGTIANGLILYALVASKQHEKKFLIFNQNALDFFSSLWLFITYSLKLCNIHLSGLSGHWMCVLILSENLIWVGLLGSRISLVAVTIERYLKVVHRELSRKLLRNPAIFSVAAFLWIVSFVDNMAANISTSAVVDGVCYSVAFWQSQAAQHAYMLLHFVMFYAIPLFITIYCYGHILVVVRRQSRVMAAHNASGSHAAPSHSDQIIRTNIIKTMIIVCAFFALFNLPLDLVYIIMTFNNQVALDELSYYSATFVMFLSVSMNPFIYATKFDPVRRVLRDLIPCLKNHNQIGAGTAT